jgi:hypothetical protein
VPDSSRRADEEHRATRSNRFGDRANELITEQSGPECAGLLGKFPSFEKRIVVFRRGHLLRDQGAPVRLPLRRIPDPSVLAHAMPTHGT